jgi:KDO2-lipid IV(A) lauroyltransferase
MLLIDLIFSRLGPLLGLTLVRILPRKWAYRVGDWVVNILLNMRESSLYRAIRSNQAVVRNWTYDDERLHDVVREVLTLSAHGLVDWFATLAIPNEFEHLACSIDEELVKEAMRIQAEGKGVIIVGAHLSNFNMLLMKIAQQNWPVQILAYAAEEGSYQSDNIFRRKFGLEVTPISPSSLSQAYRRLKSGGFVLTGVDRPDTGSEELSFFGRATTLPIGHARLALRTGARIMIVAVQTTDQATYHVVGSEIIEPELIEDGPNAARNLAQKVITHLEKYIQERPSEWMMFIPVWPEILPDQSMTS